ncbi:hypothetical protein PPL_02453 [Heterostelium album PN500]|uniref:Uncharacterized protein n=1 Tax=Heterostelium pallidum (strain ATCC 26659 / Pp 5 / PN500) TaxID=670386 RepID=D3B246_HETP5|nr:hypothetical protein PPL_02453 [Heterostelium album PN500]EFA84421.1 hypothetical protein PPL_02453 [Heterostelium album PN500]|eukprot:XP_020436535.1 hypothetical protein PPL_02453 [Heterostelium album PN500]
MVQGFNFEAIKSIGKIIGNRSLLIPHLEFKDVRSIDFQRLKQMGFSAVLFDKDNTLTEPYADVIYEPFREAVDRCRGVFGEQSIAILSNSAGSSDDVDFREATRLESTLGLSVLKHGTKKPNGIEKVKEHFHTDNLQSIVMIGDRYSTDVVFGNLYGMLTIFTKPITSKGDNNIVKLIRDKESRYVDYCKNYYEPPKHSLFDKDRYNKSSASS